MDKRHKITAAVSAGALLVALGTGGVAYTSYHQSQVNKQAVATAKANKAKAAELSQVQIQTYRMNKIYAECIVQAKKAKTIDAGAACTD